MKTVLTIAGFDPSSGAGVTADLMVFAAHGLFGTSCITALTVQSTLGVTATYPVKSDIIKETLDSLDADLPPSGIKIGMIYSADNIREISRYCTIVNAINTEKTLSPIVLDPVIRSSSGRGLIDASGLRALLAHLLPLVDWITPNLDELAALSGHKVDCREDIPRVSRILQKAVANNRVNGRQLGVIATGGHLETPDDYMLTPEGEEFWFSGPRIESTSTHGTGCAFSSSFLSRLVLGDAPDDACAAAKAYVAGAISNGIRLGNGANPVNHLWNIQKVID